MVKSIRFWVAVVLLAVLTGCIIMKYVNHPAQQSIAEPTQTSNTLSQTSTTDTVYEEQPEMNPVDETSVQKKKASDRSEVEKNNHAESTEPDASVPIITEQKVNEITKKLHEVSLYSSDLIGWIYIADSDIDYPIVKSKDNHYYLFHAPDGSYNQLGTIFLSYHCTPDFSDALNILYGHNMQYGMFGDIRKFKQREQFDKHRYGWLFTKEELYRIDFYALSIVSAYDAIYDIPADSSEWQECLKANSMYYIEPDLNDDDSVVALSTCASDFADARALFAGKLVWEQKINLS